MERLHQPTTRGICRASNARCFTSLLYICYVWLGCLLSLHVSTLCHLFSANRLCIWIVADAISRAFKIKNEILIIVWGITEMPLAVLPLLQLSHIKQWKLWACMTNSLGIQSGSYHSKRIPSHFGQLVTRKQWILFFYALNIIILRFI